MTERLHSDSDPYWLLAQLWSLGLQNSWLADNCNWERTIVLKAFFMHMMAPPCKENIALTPGVCCCCCRCCCLWQCSRQSEPGRSNSLHQLSSLFSLISDFLSHTERCVWSRLKHTRWPFDRNDRNGMHFCFYSHYTIIRCWRRRWRPKMKLWLQGHSVATRGVTGGS